MVLHLLCTNFYWTMRTGTTNNSVSWRSMWVKTIISRKIHTELQQKTQSENMFYKKAHHRKITKYAVYSCFSNLSHRLNQLKQMRCDLRIPFEHSFCRLFNIRICIRRIWMNCFASLRRLRSEYFTFFFSSRNYSKHIFRVNKRCVIFEILKSICPSEIEVYRPGPKRK